MKDATGYIIKGLYNTLNTHVTYNGEALKVVTAVKKDMPDKYIYIGSTIGLENGDKSKWAVECTTTIEVVAKYEANYGSVVEVNDISNAVIDLIEGGFTVDNYAMITSVIENIENATESDNVFNWFIKRIRVKNLVEMV
jgi:hypothetical protein